jgi:hypothetical protein
MNMAKILPLVTQLGNYLKEGVEHYTMLKASGVSIDADLLAAWLGGRMSAWDPKLSGRSLLDDPTREAAARFLAGIAINFVGAK